MNTRSGTGILQVAFGHQYLEEAIQSAKSAKAMMPDTPIALVADATSPEADALFDQVIILKPETPDIPEKFWGFYNKVCGLQASPFVQTLFMDVDILCVCDVAECFTMLEKKTMLAVPVPPRDRGRDSFATANPLPPMNTGVLGLNFDKLPDDFFEVWKQLYIDQCPDSEDQNFGDQSVFRKLVWDLNIDLLLLDYAYNFRFSKPALFSGPVKLLHGRASNAAYVGNFINMTTAPRFYLPATALLAQDQETRDWIVYPYDAPREPSRFSTLTFADAFLLLAQDNGLDSKAAEEAFNTLKAMQTA
ncbi:hypothetical protein [Kordiimonas marina]|uniref:hypothetical protein n=1 Tax=Kordiimonas marina TaxID=2872312 RepID=UPI001FF57E76|nr:hypothetical protein [Kordiimonas marina]MCJ9427668.1 hypothetical protein [Kordiimonas marina]